MKKYLPFEIEPKWQKKWKEEKLYDTDLTKPSKKYYTLVELPYTSGDLHMGHWFTFTMGDIIARFKRMTGLNVIFPNGFDAFGLPAENAAIKQDIHPKDWTFANIKRMQEQFYTTGASIDWEKTAITCESEYYKWNQWIFLKMLEKGIAYKGKAFAKWCPSCKTVLADENVEAGKCWRCGSEVIQKEVEQWFLKLTAYADRLLWQDPPQANWPKPLQEAQNAWIGKSEGIVIKFQIPSTKSQIECFTTRPDTIFGATFIVLAPEHPQAQNLASGKYKNVVNGYIIKSGQKSELERKENKEKTGVFTGTYALNPVNNQKIPIYIADYVLMGYGTGAVMGVPGSDRRDFEFAKQFGLEIVRVVVGKDGDMSAITHIDQVQEDEGKMVNSSFLDGMGKQQAIKKIMDYIEEKKLGRKQVLYHLHDWSISRQRYWGTPIPVVYCDKCGMVSVPEEDLPVELPYQVDYQPQGKPPLATAQDWVNTKCPKCKGKAKREVETMDGFVDNSWYFYRYLDPKNLKAIFDKDLISKWMPVDIYIGGAEHTVGHTLYSRFFTKFFHDLGLVEFDEYAKKRVHHGVILGPDGARMSKSRGNIVNPDIQVKSYGADAIRVYLMFLGPFDIVAAWNPDGINGIYHFLQRVWGLQEKLKTQNSKLKNNEDLKIMHKTIKKVGEDIEQLKFNTAIASLMEWLNHLSRKNEIAVEEYKTFLLLLAPFAPHMSEELWEITGEKYSIHKHLWPKFDEKYLEEAQISIVVQINGKVREIILIQKDMISNSALIEKIAKESPKIQKILAGKAVKRVVYIPSKILNFVVNAAENKPSS